MSHYSGKCDLADHIQGMGGWYDREGNPVKFGDENVHAYYSDEYRDFLEFKKRTGGVLHQHRVFTVTPWNHEEAVKLCPKLEVIEHKRIVPDKRKKSGQREEVYYTYKYWDKEYTLKELNKKKVYITVDIHFNTLLDLIPYYPYLVSMACSNDGKQTIYISDESYVDEKLNSQLAHGWYSDYWQHDKRELQDHYRQVVLRYFNPEGREHVEEVTFDENGIGHVSKPIDENFYVEWRWVDNKAHGHWTSPKIIDADKGEILMHQNDLMHLGSKMLVYYVEKKEYPVYLW